VVVKGLIPGKVHLQCMIAYM